MTEDTFTSTEDGAAAFERQRAIDEAYEPNDDPDYWEPPEYQADEDEPPLEEPIEPAPEDLSDEDLPGAWSRSDFTGGDPDERSYAERGWAEGHDDNSASERGSHWEDE